MSDPLKNISPLDGRYSKSIETLSDYFSESALIKYRMVIVGEWVDAGNKQTFETLSLFNIQRWAVVSAACAKDIDKAVKAAQYEFK